MILVTLGTQKQPFTRLLDAIENSDINEEIIVQAGYTKYDSKKMKIFDFISYEEMGKLVDNANIIITHGGTGSIVGPLKKNKKIIAAARLSKYGEHVDDHQTEIVSKFADEGYIIQVREMKDLGDAIKNIEKFNPREYKGSSEELIDAIINIIESL